MREFLDRLVALQHSVGHHSMLDLNVHKHLGRLERALSPGLKSGVVNSELALSAVPGDLKVQEDIPAKDFWVEDLEFPMGVNFENPTTQKRLIRNRVIDSGGLVTLGHAVWFLRHPESIPGAMLTRNIHFMGTLLSNASGKVVYPVLLHGLAGSGHRLVFHPFEGEHFKQFSDDGMHYPCCH